MHEAFARQMRRERTAGGLAPPGVVALAGLGRDGWRRDGGRHRILRDALLELGELQLELFEKPLAALGTRRRTCRAAAWRW
jgi:hypothetical protein